MFVCWWAGWDIALTDVGLAVGWMVITNRGGFGGGLDGLDGQLLALCVDDLL